MPYDAELAERVRSLLRRRLDVVEKRMFGGIVFMLGGNICVGIWHEALIARVGPEAYAAALGEPHVREFDVTGRPMNGWVLIDPEGVETSAGLRSWIERAVRFVVTLPEK